VLCRGSKEFPAVDCEEPGCQTDEIHSLLLDQADASEQMGDNFESVYDNSINSSGTESTLLNKLDYIVHSPHLCQENNPGANAFGLRDLHHPPPGFTNHITSQSSNADNEFLNVQPSSSFPQDVLHCYGSPFPQHIPLPFHNPYYATTTTAQHSNTFYTDRNHNTLFPLSSVEQTFLQPLSGTTVQNKLQAVVQSSVGGTQPYEQYTSLKTTDSTKDEPSTVAESNNGTGHRLFSNDILPPPLAPVQDRDIPDDGSHVSSVGTIGETKPIGFVPAIKGTALRSEAESAAEADDIGQLGQDIDARLTTTARVQPSSKLSPQQQPAASNSKAEMMDSDVHGPPTADECQSVKDIARPALMPGYPGPVPWPIPPYPGAPFPYPFYPPWAYCPPVPMMPMMPHPMMQMVPMPCWVPPMHPAMRMRFPVAPPSAAETTEKPEVSSETKTMN